MATSRRKQLAARRAQGYVKPKFKHGDIVQHATSPQYIGEVSFVGSYEASWVNPHDGAVVPGMYKYKVLEPNGRRNYWDETSMILVHRPKSHKTGKSSEAKQALARYRKMLAEQGK